MFNCIYLVSSGIDEGYRSNSKHVFVADKSILSESSASGSYISLVPISKVSEGDVDTPVPYFEHTLISWLTKNRRVSRNNHLNVQGNAVPELEMPLANSSHPRRIIQLCLCQVS